MIFGYKVRNRIDKIKGYAHAHAKFYIAMDTTRMDIEDRVRAWHVYTCYMRAIERLVKIERTQLL